MSEVILAETFVNASMAWDDVVAMAWDDVVSMAFVSMNSAISGLIEHVPLGALPQARGLFSRASSPCHGKPDTATETQIRIS